MKLSILEYLRKKGSEIYFLLIILFLFFLMRLPSFVEPDWYGDEGIYQVIGRALSAGRILYKEIWDNKPPLLYVLYGFVNGDLFSIRLLSFVFGFFAVLVFYAFAKKLFANKKSSYVSTIVFALLFGLPLIEGNIANAENFMLFPIILGFYLVFGLKTQRFTRFVIAGLLLSFAFLIKIVAIFDLAALISSAVMLEYFEKPSYAVILQKLQKELSFSSFLISFRKELALIAAFVFPIFITFLYFIKHKAVVDFLKASFSQNVGYVGYGNYFLFPLGGLIVKLLLLAIALAGVFHFRKLLGREGIIVLIWLFFSLFNALFSQRPYGHYMLTLLPAFCFMIGFVLDQKKLLKITVPILLIFLVIVYANFAKGFYTKTIRYYANYIAFMQGKKNVSEYQSFFDRNTPRDYDIANFIAINTKPTDEVLLISDSGQIYILANKLPPGRYIVSYHMTFYKDAISETKKAIDLKNPKYIIATKDVKDFATLLSGYHLSYKMENVTIYEK